MRGQLQQTLQNMKARCHNPRNPRYKDYGGRGIGICDEWEKSSAVFYDWALNHGFKSGLTIDRIDVNGNYEPKNCRWITNQEQQLNRRNNRLLTIDGKTKTITEWCRDKNINVKTVEKRLHKGIKPKYAFFSPQANGRDLSGKRYGKVVVIKFDRIKNRRTYWICKCDCGKVFTTRADNLTGGGTTSCGCSRSKTLSKV